METVLDSTFEKVIYTPQPENLFTLNRIPPTNWINYKHRKNIIIAAPLNSNSPMQQNFLKLLLILRLKIKL